MLVSFGRVILVKVHKMIDVGWTYIQITVRIMQEIEPYKIKVFLTCF